MATYLVVDDSPTLRMTLDAAVRRATHGNPEIVHAEDSASALRAFETRDVDVVFLDMMLAEGKGGLETLRAMLEMRPGTRIVLVTALERDHPDVVSAISLGAFAHVTKPVRVHAVKEVLEQIEVEAGRSGRIR